MVGMRKRNLATIDLDTGEVIQGVFANSKTKFNPWGEGYIMTARYGSKFLARDKSITGVAYESHHANKIQGSNDKYRNDLLYYPG